MFKNIIQGFKEIFFPDNCLLCRTYLNSHHQKQICTSCTSAIKLNTPPFCTLCSRHLDSFDADGICPSCRKHSTHFDRAWSVSFFEGHMRDLIHQFKYKHKTHLRKTFLNLITQFIDQYQIPIHNFDVVCPISLHPVRLRERGFNQSEILSQDLSAHYQLRHIPNLLIRSKATETQTHLELKHRFTNLDSAFTINPSQYCLDKSVLIVDDLLTTGATVSSAASALKNAGASYVGVLTLASTRLSDS